MPFQYDDEVKPSTTGHFVPDDGKPWEKDWSAPASKQPGAPWGKDWPAWLVPVSDSPEKLPDWLVPVTDAEQKPASKKPGKRTWTEAAGDTAIDVAKGVVGLGESVVGLTDLATGNLAGQGWSELGFDPARTKQILSEGYSDSRQQANANVQNAEGFVDTTKALIANPSAAVGAMAESAPMMLGSVAAVRTAAAKMLATRGLVAGSAEAAAFLENPAVVARLTAIGSAAEGATTTGQIQEQGRQAGRDYMDTAPSAVAAGVLTGAIGFGTSRIPGFKDAEVGAAVAGMGKTERTGLITAGKEIAKGAFKEGVLEELPQSAQEQIFTNLALGHPWDEGVAEAAAQGMVAGAGMGGGMNTYTAARNAVAGKAQPTAVAQHAALSTPGGGQVTVIEPSQPPVETKTKTDSSGRVYRPEARLAELEVQQSLRPLTEPELAEGQALVSELMANHEEAAPAKPANAPGDFWTFARERGYAPDDVKPGSDNWNAVQAEFRQAQSAPAVQPEDSAKMPSPQSPAPTITPILRTPTAPAPQSEGVSLISTRPSASQPAPAIQTTEHSSKLTNAPITQPAPAVAAPQPVALPDVSLQNRDRSRAASVLQMQAIASQPDYMRLGPSRTPDSGAPMVFAVGDDTSKIAPSQFGKQDVAVMADGQRVPFRYAVVEANQVEPSNFADGNGNPAFTAEVPGTLKALNNGRSAGLRSAHERGTANQYTAELVQDAKNHGVPTQAIASMTAPMLVRVYSQANNSKDMAAKSQGQGLGMTPGELARQDAPLMDATVLTMHRASDVTSVANRDFVRAFIGKLQQSGQDIAGMLTAQGDLSPNGRTRIQAALVQAAYGDADLVQEMFDSQDTDIKSIGEALKTMAGPWANMRDSVAMGVLDGDVDITGNLVQAVNLIRQSRQERKSLIGMVNQPDLMTGETPDALTTALLGIFYSGASLTRALGRDKVVDKLDAYVQAAMNSSSQPGMFDDAMTPAEILATITQNGAPNEQRTQTQDSSTEPVSSSPAGGNPGQGGNPDQRPVNDSAGDGLAGNRQSESENTSGDIRPASQATDQGHAAQDLKAKNEDVGQQLYANRRNFTGRGLKWEDVQGLNDTLKVAEVTKAKVWPRPDYEKLTTEGMPPVLARLVKQVYDGISAGPTLKAIPSDEQLKLYIDALAKVREALFGFVNDPQAVSEFARAVVAVTKGSQPVGGPVDAKAISETLVRRIWPEEFKQDSAALRRFSRGTQAASEISILGGSKSLLAMQFTRPDFNKWVTDLSKGWPGKREAWQVQGLRVLAPGEYTVTGPTEITRYNRTTGTSEATGEFRYSVKTDKKSWSLTDKPADGAFMLVNTTSSFAKPYPTAEAATEAAREKVKRQAGVGQDTRGTNIDEAERTGPARRGDGKDITSQRLMDHFGFRGVNFGREGWINQAERQAYLNQAYDGLLDLADVLGVPPKAMSLNGKLGIAFGAQGKGKFAAHFVPGVNEINLTRTRGAGSLAHEWGHGLDHYFATQAGLDKVTEPMLSEHASSTRLADGIRPEIVNAFRAIYQAMHKRNESIGEAKMRRDAAQASAVKSLNAWLKAARGSVESSTAGNKVDLLAEFDQHAQKLREGDAGEGVEPSGKQVFTARVAAIRNLIKDATGKLWSLDETKGLESNARYVRSLLAKQESDATHEPQQVATAFKRDSLALDKEKGGKAYWSTPTEMFARAFELYVHDRLSQQGNRNTFLTDADARANIPVTVADNTSAHARGASASRDLYVYPVGMERDAIRQAFDSLIGQIKTKETDTGVAMFSRAKETDAERNALQALSENDELFALPKSDKDTVEGIAADTNPAITVKKLNHPGLVQTYVLTLPDGARAKLMVRQTNPYGPQTYGLLDRGDADLEAITERPGDNAESVPADTEDVYIDVSELKEGGFGSKIYNIAATFAHNTGRILIGDPAGLSDVAMRRRTEHMLSSALKFGTTRHLAPHPRQVMGASDIGVPPMRWTYGDDLSNIESLIKTSTESLDHAGGNPFTFDPSTGNFRDSEGGAIDDGGISLAVGAGSGRSQDAGRTTLKRDAILSSLLRQQSAESRTGTPGMGILERLVDVGRQYPVSSKSTFYSRGGSNRGLTAPQVSSIVDAITARWANPPEVVVLASMDAAPAAVLKEFQRQNSKGASGSTEGFYFGSKVYVVADQLGTPSDVMRVLFHESLGHMGLRGAFGGAIKPVLVNILQARRTEVAAKAKQYGLDMNKPDEAMAAAEEVLADMAQNKPELGFVQRAIAAIRTWLRDNVTGFGDLELTDAEIIRSFILPARTHVEQGNDAPADQAMAFKRAAPVTSSAFAKWFEGSKIVDANGKPLVLYHGTTKNFAEFKMGPDIEAPNGASAKALGFFFTGEADTAEGFISHPELSNAYADGGHVMPVYLAVRNPKTESMDKIEDIEANWTLKKAQAYRARLEAQGYDGIIFRDKASGGVEYVAFHPEQIKSAIGNDGSFDSASPDIRFSRNTVDGKGTTPKIDPPQQNAWTRVKDKVDQLTSPEAINKLIYEFQDKYIDLKNLRDHIKALGGTVTDLNDAYLGEELYHQRLAKRTQDFLSDELKPLLADMRARGITLASFEEYLHGRHAPEANAELARHNPSRTELDAKQAKSRDQVLTLEANLAKAKLKGTATKAIEDSLIEARGELAVLNSSQAFKGDEAKRQSLSGMSNDQAKAIMEALTPARRVHMEKLAEQVDAITGKTLDVLGDYGLMDRASLSTWGNRYQYYVPLHRDEAHAESSKHPIGQGFSVKGAATKSRTGSNAQVTNILAHIALQREAALTRGEKNNVVKKLYLLASQNPDSDVWEVDTPPTVKTIDSSTGFVRTSVDPGYKNRPNVLMVRIAGKDAAIVFNEHNKEAVRLAGAMKNLDVGDLHVVLGLAAKGTRWFASVNTQYNPVFGLINFARDLQDGLLNLSTTPLAGKQLEVSKGVFDAMRAVYRHGRGTEATDANSKTWLKLWDSLQSTGGTTGYRDLYADVTERVSALEKELKSLDRGDVSKAAHAVVDWLSTYNEAMENAVRLSAYKVALDSGMTQERAASLAKNLTVNFNRKGRQTREIGALYAFFNAAVQGTTRMAETLKGPVGKKIMLGGVMMGAVNALVGMVMMGGGDDDWDKIPDFIKERSLIVPLGQQDFVSIPMPLGFKLFPNIGRIAMETAFGGPKHTPGKAISSLLSALVDTFNPLGGAQDLGQLVAPTVIDPVVALMQNKDWTGRPIYRENSNGLDQQPGHAMAKDSASSIGKGLAKAINAVTGGTEYRPGAWSPTPDQIDYVFGQLSGGLGRELLKVNQTLSAQVTGDELPPYKIPLVGRLYGNTHGQAGQSDQFYQNVKAINEVENEYRGRARNRQDTDELRQTEPLVNLIGAGNQAERQVSLLRKYRKMLVERADTGYQERVKEIDGRIAEVMTRFNREVDKAQRKVDAE
jgi:hypothetical protein